MSFTDPNRIVPEVRTGVYDSVLSRNGDVADGGAVAALANFTYSNLCRRRRVLYSRNNGTSFAAPGLHAAQFYVDSEAIEGGVYCTLFFGDSGFAGVLGLATFNVNGVAETIPSTPISSATAAAGPSDRKSVTFRLLHAVSGLNTLDWSIHANAGIYGMIVYGGVASNPSTGNALAAETVLYPWSAGVAVSGVELPISGAWQQWTRESTHYFGWSGNFSVSTTTYTNVASGTVTGWGSNVPGFWVIPEKQSTLSSTSVACKLWCYASCTIVGAGRLRIQDSTGVLATILNIGVAGYYTADVTLNASLTQSALTVVEASCTAGTITVDGAGLYAFTT